MKGWQTGLVGVAVVAAAGAAGAPFVIGMQAESSFRQAIASVSQPSGVKLEVKSYRRGWFGGEATSQLELPGEGEKLELIHTIKHGPFLPGGALFEVSTQPRLTGADAAGAKFYFGDKAPLVIDYRMGLDSVQKVTFEVPAYSGPMQDNPQAKLDWSGLRGQLVVTGGNRAVGSFEVAKVALEGGAEGSLNLTGLGGRFDGTRQNGLWYGNADLGLERFIAADNSADKIRFAAFQRLDGSKVAIGWSLDVSGFTVAGEKWGKAGYAAELTNIDASLLADFQARTEKLGAAGLSAEASEMELQRMMTELMPRLLAGQPRFSVPRLSVESPKGEINASLNVDYKGGAVTDPEALMRGIVANAELRMPLVVAQDMAARIYSEQMSGAVTEENDGSDEPQSLTPEQLQALAASAAAEQIDDMVAQKVVSRQGEYVASKARFEQGRLYVNDQLLMDMTGDAAASE